MTIPKHNPLIALVMMAWLALVPQASAAPDDPAARQIETFDNALLDAMKNAAALGVEGRYKHLAPVIDQTFNLQAMTSLVVGPYWTGFSGAERQRAIDAFRHWTIATYARNFDGFSGQKFVVDPQIATHNADKVVRTELVQDGKDPISLAYRMRETKDGWKVIDVYYMGSISQLATQRSDFSATLAGGGADAFIRKLGDLSAKLMKG